VSGNPDDPLGSCGARGSPQARIIDFGGPTRKQSGRRSRTCGGAREARERQRRRNVVAGEMMAAKWWPSFSHMIPGADTRDVLLTRARGGRALLIPARFPEVHHSLVELKPAVGALVLFGTV
jgi:hypothetical protein